MPHFAISPDSMRMLFIADKETDEVFELRSGLEQRAAPLRWWSSISSRWN
jgi:hypothetical protein